MSVARRGVVVLSALLCGLLPAAAQGDDVHARLRFRIDDPRITESSGLAVSRTRPGLLYTVNDSGDEARVLVLSAADGSVRGETRLAGVEAEDFEALAPAPGGRLVVADIGDNGADRAAVELYVVAEPGTGDADVTPRRITLRYPDGARDAEAVVVIGRRVFVISKKMFGGEVYVAPALEGDRRSATLRRVAPAPGTVTDAALLDGGEVVLRDYHRAFVVDPTGWRVRTSFALPSVEQGETLAALPGTRRILVGSEGNPSPVYVMGVPRAARPAASPPPASGAKASEGQTDEKSDARSEPRLRPPGYVLAVAAAALVAALVRRRRRR